MRERGSLTCRGGAFRPVVPLGVAVVALGACVTRPAAEPASRVAAETLADGVRLVEGGRPVLFYRVRPGEGRESWRVHYVHPMHSVDGAILTEDAPPDHVHHRGVFWAWRRILVDGVQVADGWVGKGLTLEVGPPVATDLPDGSARIDVRVVWWVLFDGHPQAIIEENSTIQSFPIRDGRRRVEFEVRLRGLREGVGIAGSDDEKGYGGFSVRFGNSERLAIRGDGRELQATPAVLDAGELVDFLWPSLPPPWPARVSAACTIDDRAWTRWVLRQEPSMQNCAFPGPAPVVLHEGSYLTMRISLDIE